MKYILKPILKFLMYVIFFILKVLVLLLVIIIGYIIAVALSLWNFKLEKVDMLWVIKTLWSDIKIGEK